jgi:hypothetical protein
MDAHTVSLQCLGNARFIFQFRLDDGYPRMSRKRAQLPGRAYQDRNLMPGFEELAQDVEANVPRGAGQEGSYEIGSLDPVSLELQMFARNRGFRNVARG